MARVNIPVVTIDRNGVAPGSQMTADATQKHEMVNDGKTYLEIVSTDAGAQYVDIEIPSGAVDGQAVTPRRVSVAAGATLLVAPMPKGIYNQTGGKVYIDPSVSTTLKFRAHTS